MTTVETRRASATRTGGPEPLSSRARRSVPLMVGGLLVLVLLQPVGSLPTRGWVPVLTGLAYIVAGLLSGKRGVLLGPGIVLAAWGIAPMTVQYGETEFAGMFYLCLGAGLLVAALLAQRGWYRITAMSLALPVLFIGGTMYVSSIVDDALTTVLAVLLIGWGAWELRPQQSDEPAHVA